MAVIVVSHGLMNLSYITETSLFKYTENFTIKKLKIFG